MNSLPGHYLGSVTTYAANTPWDLEYSIEIGPHGQYQFFSRDGEGKIRVRHAGSSGRAFAQFAVQNGFEAEELLRDLEYIDHGFATDFATFLERRDAR